LGLVRSKYTAVTVQSNIATPLIRLHNNLLEETPVNSECPSDAGEVAEQHYLGRLSPDRAAVFEAHMRGCEKCRQAYQETVRFIEGIRGAGKRVEFGGLEVAAVLV